MLDQTTRPAGLSETARELRRRGRELKSAPILTRMSEAARLGDELAEFLVVLAERVDSLTPYLDETHEGRGGKDLISRAVADAVAEAAEGQGARNG